MKGTSLSIVVAAQNAKATVCECLAALRAQGATGTVETIVVDNSNDGTAGLVAQRFPDVRLMRVAEPRLVPELWGLGATEARGAVIAFTTAHCIPESAWVSETQRLHQSEHAAIGGAIENAPSSSLTQWAVYFCRYAPYMPPFAPHLVDQVPADNASYKRWAAAKCADTFSAGFWEYEVNRRLRADGHTLLLTPEIRVRHEGSVRFRGFCRQRLAHGRIFGADRVAGKPISRRVLYLAGAPLIPAIFVAKLARQVLSKKRNRLEFFLSLPITMLFVLCWSLGEVLGYALGYARERGLAR